jgi:hypothetical protein
VGWSLPQLAEVRIQPLLILRNSGALSIMNATDVLPPSRGAARGQSRDANDNQGTDIRASSRHIRTKIAETLPFEPSHSEPAGAIGASVGLTPQCSLPVPHGLSSIKKKNPSLSQGNRAESPFLAETDSPGPLLQE